MFSHCADPASLEGLPWLMCYLTSSTHLSFYASFGTVLLLLAITAPIALLFGFGGSFISLLMSKWMALKSVGGEVIEQPATDMQRWLMETVAQQSR